MNDYIIPIMLQAELGNRVNALCVKKLPGSAFRYFADARGKFVYLGWVLPGLNSVRLGRLTYEGNLERMEFAIFKFSKGKYDPKDRSFRGAHLLDGTIEGAINALIETYP